MNLTHQAISRGMVYQYMHLGKQYQNMPIVTSINDKAVFRRADLFDCRAVQVIQSVKRPAILTVAAEDVNF